MCESRCEFLCSNSISACVRRRVSGELPADDDEDAFLYINEIVNKGCYDDLHNVYVELHLKRTI